MEALYLLLPLSLALVLLIALVLVLAVRSGQFDDLEGPAYRVLEDNDDVKDPTEPITDLEDRSRKS